MDARAFGSQSFHDHARPAGPSAPSSGYEVLSADRWAASLGKFLAFKFERANAEDQFVAVAVLSPLGEWRYGTEFEKAWKATEKDVSKGGGE